MKVVLKTIIWLVFESYRDVNMFQLMYINIYWTIPFYVHPFWHVASWEPSWKEGFTKAVGETAETRCEKRLIDWWGLESLIVQKTKNDMHVRTQTYNHFLLPLTLVAHPWLHYHLNLKLFHARCRTCPASFHFRDRQRSLGAQRVLIGLWKRMDPRHLGNCTAWDWTHQHFTSNMWERMDHQYQTEKTQRVSRCYVWGFAEKPAHICSAWSLRSTISW